MKKHDSSINTSDSFRKSKGQCFWLNIVFGTALDQLVSGSHTVGYFEIKGIVCGL